MITTVYKQEEQVVELSEGSLRIHDLELMGTILELAREAEQAGEELAPLVVLACELGATVLQHGKTQSFVAELSRATERLEQTLADRAAELPEELRKGSAELLAQLKNELETGLAPFDGTRVDSIQNQISTSVKSASGELVKGTVTDLLSEGGPLAGLIETINTQLQLLGRTNADMVERMTSLAEKAEASLQLKDAHERSTHKGAPYEEYLLPELEAIHHPLGDTVRYVGKEYGAENSQVGDFVVTLNPRETRGRDVRIVVEAKTGRLTAPKSAEALQDARRNREAAAAILVFDDIEDAQSVLGGRQYSQRPDGDFVVVLDPEELSPLALEVACRQARALAIASLESETAVDGQWLAEQCDRIGKLIDTAGAIKTGTKSARRSLDRIDDRYDELRAEALLVLEAIKDRLSGGGST
jgi:hypothetical protein